MTSVSLCLQCATICSIILWWLHQSDRELCRMTSVHWWLQPGHDFPVLTSIWLLPLYDDFNLTMTCVGWLQSIDGFNLTKTYHDFKLTMTCVGWPVHWWLQPDQDLSWLHIDHDLGRMTSVHWWLHPDPMSARWPLSACRRSWSVRPRPRVSSSPWPSLAIGRLAFPGSSVCGCLVTSMANGRSDWSLTVGESQECRYGLIFFLIKNK